MLDSLRKPPTVTTIPKIEYKRIMTEEKEDAGRGEYSEQEPDGTYASMENIQPMAIFQDTQLNNDPKHADYFLKLFQVNYADVAAYRMNQKQIKNLDTARDILVEEQEQLRKRIFEPPEIAPRGLST